MWEAKNGKDMVEITDLIYDIFCDVCAYLPDGQEDKALSGISQKLLNIMDMLNI